MRVAKMGVRFVQGKADLSSLCWVTPRGGLTDTRMAWCNSKFGHMWLWAEQSGRVYFKNEQDAMLFALTFEHTGTGIAK